MHPYREPGIVVEKYPERKCKIHKYVSANDAYILEKIYNWWSPSKGYDALAELLNALEGDFAKRVAWSFMSSDCEKMSNDLMYGRRDEQRK